LGISQAADSVIVVQVTNNWWSTITTPVPSLKPVNLSTLNLQRFTTDARQVDFSHFSSLRSVFE